MVCTDQPGRVRLSPREQETLTLLLEGLSAKVIADRLSIGVHTANGYTKSIFRRFGVHSRAELVARLLRPGIGARIIA
jgi:DNA-binding CsgD family transcriptional regulator